MNKYLKYTSLAFQMGFTIAILTFIGIKMDHYFVNPQPWFTIVFSLIAVVGVTIKLIIDLKNEQNNKKDNF
ncbi:MAG: AtpZ/AtpI family protein [Cytophagales bacterium]